MKANRCHLCAITLAAMTQADAANVNMTADDGSETTSFNAAGKWSSLAEPVAGNAYFNAKSDATAHYLLRTPAVADSNYTFAGDSLTITGPGVTATVQNQALLWKGTGATNNIITVNNLTINGGYLRHGSGDEDTVTFAGNGITIGAKGAGFCAQGNVLITAPILGSGAMTICDGGNSGTSRVIHFASAANNFTGNLNISTANHSRFQLDAGANYPFQIGATGVNNTIHGRGAATFNGTFHFNLSAAGTTIGNSWNLVAAKTLAESYGTTFSIPDFTSDGGTAGSRFWTRNVSGVFYQYNEATGVLSVVPPDTDRDGLADAWEMANFGNLSQTGSDDPDGDGINNEVEKTAGTNPNLDTSWPDADADGLKDEWEIAKFGNIAAQNADGDPDGDLNRNLIELTNGTDPNIASSYPDADADTMNDGWEMAFFGDLSKDGGADTDGDGFTDREEHDAHTNPTAVTGTNLSPVWSQLTHRWSFNGNLTDRVGGSDATIADVGANDVTQDATSVTLTGGPKATSDYIKLGANLLPKSTTPVTIELWAKQNFIQNWSRIFDFNNGTGEYLMMAWTTTTDNATDRLEFKDTVASSSGNVTASLTLDNTNQPWGTTDEHHIVLTLEPLAGTNCKTRITIYSAPAGAASLGAAKGTGETTLNLVNFFDKLDALGYSPWPDDTASATYNEVRIWNGALNAWTREQLHTQGPDKAAIPDADGDFLPDAWETRYFNNTTTATSAAADNDGDGASNRDEFLAGSNPDNKLSTPDDVDADGLADIWEIQFFTNITAQDGTGDPDGDGLTNEQEETGGTSPNSNDRDGGDP